MATTTSQGDTGPVLTGFLATPATARWLALGAVAGPVLFTLAWFILGFLSPGYTLFGTLIAPYSPISQPISGLGLGPTGPFMNTAFLVSGLVLRRVPRWRRFGSWLLLGSPLTLVLLVLFFATFNPTAAGANLGVSGLTQRVLAVEIHAWYVAMGWLAFRRS